MSKKETALTTGNETEMTVPGTFMPSEFEELMTGFSSIDTLMMGQGEGKLPIYLGEMIGPGAEVEVTAPDETVNKLPTWAFHPITRAGTVQNVTHVIPAAHQLHGALDRVYRTMKETNKRAQVGIMCAGKVVTRKGRQLNTYRVFEKYI